MSLHHRRWADLRLWRLILALIVAPLPSALVALVIGAGSERATFERFVWYCHVIAECAVLWSLVAGLLYLGTVTRWRRTIGRRECMILGAIATLLFPYAVVLLRHFAPLAVLQMLALHPHRETFADELLYWTQPFNLMLSGISLSFGIVSGWIFWTIGVRPAPIPLPDVRGVFE